MYQSTAIRLILIAVLAVAGSGFVWRDAVASARHPVSHSRATLAAESSDNEADERGPGPGAAPTRPVVRGVTIERGGRVFPSVTYLTEPGPDGREMAAGLLIVKFKPATRRSAQADAHRLAGALGVDALGVDGTHRVQVAPGRVIAALAAYQQRADVAYAEPDYVARLSLIPNDPGWHQQWGMAKIGAPQAWDQTRSRADIRVAILDCGIYSWSSNFGSGHPDIRDKVVGEVNFTASPYGVDDYCNHGTHVAGIAAAATNNGLGVAGVGFDASVLNVKVLDDTGTGLTSTVAQGIVWAADNGARVVNLSLGSDLPCSQTYQTAVDYAWARGVVIVAAAGNEGLPASGQPANCTHVISVAATDQADNRAGFSNYGANVDVAAPGVGIVSTDYVGGYKSISGTSQASPHVAGLAALVWATQFGGTNQTVSDRILSTADRVAGTGVLWASGRVNAASAVGVLAPPPAPPPLACAPRPPVKLVAVPQGGLLRVTITAGNGNLQELRFPTDPHVPNWNAVIFITEGEIDGRVVRLPPGRAETVIFVRRQAAGGATTVPFIAVDGCGEWPTFVGGGTGAGF